MKKLLMLAALAALTVTAHSAEWLSRDGMSKISNAPDGGYYLMNHDMVIPEKCTITEWPISEPVGTMECTGGFGNVTIEIKNKTTLVIGGYEYYRLN